MNNKTLTVNLPDIGEGVVEGEVIEWLKQVGETVKQDEPVIVVMTDKATVELPAPAPGSLIKQYYQVGEIALVDQPLYDIALSGQSLAQPTTPQQSRPVEKAPERTSRITRHYGSKSLAAPPVRKLAQEMGIDINQVKGTGIEGKVTICDLQKANSKTSSDHLTGYDDDEVVPITGVRRLMVDSMTKSIHHVAHFSYFEQVDATELVRMRKDLLSRGQAVTYMPIFIAALSKALKRHPEFNSNFDETGYKLIKHHVHNIGIAIRSNEGLIVPVLHNVHNMKFDELVHAYNTLIEKAGKGLLAPEDMKGSTFTISNFGSLSSGGQWATPVINYPEVGILALARIQQQPVVKDGQVVACDTLNLSWSFDHRVIDGNLAATFSHQYAQLLEKPIDIT